MLRFLRVVFGIISSPLLLNATKDFVELNTKDSAEIYLNELYMLTVRRLDLLMLKNYKIFI